VKEGQQIQQGWSQMTPAQKAIIGLVVGGARRAVTRKKGKKKKGKAAKAIKKARAGVKKAKRGAAHLVKGSLAAKRFMAKLRKKVGKK
jgi:hypothetical protein